MALKNRRSMADKFTIRDIEEFQKLNKRLQQLERWEQAIAEEREKLDRQEQHLVGERQDIQKKLKTTYKALSNAKSLFSTPKAENAPMEIESKHYVSANDKEMLLEKILNDYKLLNPKEKTCSFNHIKNELAQKYEIETRSISNFFVGLLSNYELVGGNRNKAIVMPKTK